jgi:phage minor structural protein
MISEIDLSLKVLIPRLSICRPSGTPIGNLKEAVGTLNYKVNLGRLNEIDFSVPYALDINHELKTNPNIDKLKGRYLIKLKYGQGTELFIINSISESMDDNGDVKQVHAFSLGYELNDKEVRALTLESKNATYSLGEALRYTIWSVGYVDSDFDLKFRSFDVSEKTVLDFVYEIAETFNAVVEFDTVNRQIHLKKAEKIGTNKGFRTSYGKLMKALNLSTPHDENFVTKLNIYGADNLSINRVNPSGQSYIQDFSFFLFPFQRDANKNVIESSEYMSDELCHAILDYDIKLATKKGEFETFLSQKETHQATLTIKNNEMNTLQTDLLIIEDTLDVAKANGDDLTTLNQQKADKQTEINSKQSEIDAINSQIASVDSQITTLRNDIAMDNPVNFTAALLTELNRFIVERTWSDSNYIDDKDLYEDGLKRFDEMRKPQTVFDINVVNFLEVLDEQRNWDKLNLGDIIRIKYEKFNVNVTAKIIGIDYNFSNGDIKLTIANVKDIHSIIDDYTQLLRSLKQSESTGTTVDMSKFKWNQTSENLGEVNDIINGVWDAAKRKIIAGVNETVEISRKGILIKDDADPNEYLVMKHGIIGMTLDGGNTWKTAITPHQIVGERIMGKIIAGVNLTIENDAGKFLFDSNGVKIQGTYLTIEKGTNGIELHPTNGITVTRENKVRTMLNATDGIKIQKYELGVWKDKLYADIDGNLIVEDLTARRLIMKDGSNNVLVDSNTKTINFTGFNVITGKDYLMKGLTVYNSSGQLTFSVDLNGNVSFKGDLTGSNGEFSGTLKAGIEISAPKITGGEITGATLTSTVGGYSNTVKVYDGTVEVYHPNVISDVVSIIKMASNGYYTGDILVNRQNGNISLSAPKKGVFNQWGEVYIGYVNSTTSNNIVLWGRTNAAAGLDVSGAGITSLGRINATAGLTVGGDYGGTFNSSIPINANAGVYSNGSTISAGIGSLTGGSLTVSNTAFAGWFQADYNITSTGGFVKSNGGQFRASGSSIYMQNGSGGYADVYGQSFVPSSLRELKTNISLWDKSALELINNYKISTYQFKSDYNIFDEDGNVVGQKSHDEVSYKIGIILDEAPVEIQSGNGIELYAMTSLNSKGLQELSLETRTENQLLRQELALLKQEIELLKNQ